MNDRGCSHLDAIEAVKQPQRAECEEDNPNQKNSATPIVIAERTADQQERR